MNRLHQLEELVPKERAVQRVTEPPDDYPGPLVGLLVIEPGADRIKCAALWFPFLAPGAFVAMEPISDDHKREVVEKRLGRHSIEDGWAVFYP